KEKFTGDIKTIGMRGVSGCDATLVPPSDSSPPLTSEAFELAKWIDTNYNGKPVDIIAAGVSGLVVRYALAQSQRHAEGQGGIVTLSPDDLHVEDVVTLGTPHQATTTMNGACPECSELAASDTALWSVLNTSEGQHPNGVGGTDWSAIASNGDKMVPVSS